MGTPVFSLHTDLNSNAACSEKPSLTHPSATGGNSLPHKSHTCFQCLQVPVSAGMIFFFLNLCFIIIPFHSVVFPYGKDVVCVVYFCILVTSGIRNTGQRPSLYLLGHVQALHTGATLENISKPPPPWALGGFPRSSASKESAYNAEEPDSTPGLGRSPGERNGNPLQYSFLENPMGRGAWQATVHGVTRVGYALVTKPLPQFYTETSVVRIFYYY